MIYFTSDIQFGNYNYSIKRGFNNIHEMDETIIYEWNTVITKTDIVYSLGNLGSFVYLPRLNGSIINLQIDNNKFITQLIKIGKYNLVLSYFALHTISNHINIHGNHEQCIDRICVSYDLHDGQLISSRDVIESVRTNG